MATVSFVLFVITIAAITKVSTASCSATVTPPGTFTNSSGLIKTDSDGSGTAMGTGPDGYFDDCKWTILCPTGANNYLFYKMNGNVNWLTTVTAISKPSAAHNFSYTGSSSNPDLYHAAIVDLQGTQTVDVTYKLEYRSSFKSNGVDFEYHCRKAKCLNLQNTTLSEPQGLISVNGLYHGEACRWRIECPAGYQQGLTVTVAGRVGSADTMSFTPDSEAGYTAAGGAWYAPSSPLRKTFLASRMSISLDAGASSIGSPTDIQYLCHAKANTKVCNASSSGAGYDNPNGISVNSDIDGDSSRIRGQPGELCYWWFRCTVGTVYFSDFNANVGANRVTLLHSSAPGIPELFNFTGRFSLPRFYTGAADVLVQYDVSESAYGFSLKAYCTDESKQSCDTATTTKNEVTKWQSDSDGIGTSGRMRFETCLFHTINCQTGAAVFEANYRLASTKILVVDGIGSANMLATQSEWAGSMKRYVDGDKAVIQIYPRSTTTVESANYGLTMSYTCVASLCSGNFSGQVQSLESCNSTTGDGCKVITLATDLNGQGKGGFLEGEQCTSFVQCPGQQYLAYRVPRVADGTSVVVAPIDRVDGWNTSVTLSLFEWWWAFSPLPASVELSFKATATGDSMLSAEVRCAPSRCDTSEHTRVGGKVSEIIYLSGGKGRRYSSNAKCSIRISCPAAYDSIRFKCDGLLRASGDYVVLEEFELGEDNEPDTSAAFTRFDSRTQSGSLKTSFVASSPAARFLFESGFHSGRDDGVEQHCSFVCENSTEVSLASSNPSPTPTDVPLDNLSPSTSGPSNDGADDEDETLVRNLAIGFGILFVICVAGCVYKAISSARASSQRKQAGNQQEGQEQPDSNGWGEGSHRSSGANPPQEQQQLTVVRVDLQQISASPQVNSVASQPPQPSLHSGERPVQQIAPLGASVYPQQHSLY